MSKSVRVMIEQGTKGKRYVAYAVDWPGWSRGAKSEEAAYDVLESYRERYRPVARLAGLGDEFDATGSLEVTERYVGTGSTDFWGISFSSCPLELTEPMTDDECERKLALMQATWSYFDDTYGRVSAELQKGPRGVGRSRDEILNHTYATERTQFAPKIAVDTPQAVMLTPDGLRDHRDRYLAAIRSYQAETKNARTWSLPFLIRHTAYHMMDHAWEMQDKDLTSKESK